MNGIAAVEGSGAQRVLVLHGYGSNRSAPLADGMEGMAASALTPVSPQGTPLDEASYESFKSAWADPGPVLRSLAPHLH